MILKLYQDYQAGNHAECRRVQLKLEELIGIMLTAGNFPEGFRAAVALRGFDPGPARFPIGPHEQAVLAEAKNKIACILGECGYHEASRECERRWQSSADGLAGSRIDLEKIVRSVVSKYKS